MKRDINLMPPRPEDNTYVILISIVVAITLVFMAIFIPIKRKNQLMAKSKRIAKEMMDYETLDIQYNNLEKHSMDLEQIIELFSRVNSKQNDTSILTNIIDNSISTPVELTDINISGNILHIKGKAPNDGIIADIVRELWGKDKISSVRIQEITLDKIDSKRIFDIKCITFVNQLNVDEIFVDDQEKDQTAAGGDED